LLAGSGRKLQVLQAGVDWLGVTGIQVVSAHFDSYIFPLLLLTLPSHLFYFLPASFLSW
jgi:hypothetical protein